MTSNFPDHDSLPVVKGQPHGAAWALFNSNGNKDVYGCLNKITPSVIKAAGAEIKDGVSISLNWSMGAIKKPGFYRKGLVHKVTSFVDTPLHIHGFDDEVEFNTQCSSQWDSLCHFFHQDSASGYNGAKPSIEDLTRDLNDKERDKSLPTLEHWHNRGGIVTRGVLLDYVAYAVAHGINYSPYDAHKITLAEVRSMAQEHNVMFRQGDVVLIRTGYTDGISAATNDEERNSMVATNKSVGVEGTMEAVKYFWNIQCAAVACDTVGFEVCPPASADGIDGAGTSKDLIIHQHFLSLLGLPIGELWDLKALAEYCQKANRYTFMLTSIPLNFPGAVGSPPNALAIF